MERKDEELLQKLLPTFRIEARDHLQAISSGLIEIEKRKPGQQAAIIETIYREAHSLKGAARSVNIAEVEAICQSMENVFSALKRTEITPSADLLDRLHHAVDRTFRLIAGEDLSPSDRTRLAELARRFEDAAPEPASPNGPEAVAVEPEHVPVPPSPAETEIPVPPGYLSSPVFSSYDTVRISTDKLNALLRQAEEMLLVKIAISRLAGELKELNSDLVQWKKERTRRDSSLKAMGLERKGGEQPGEEIDSFLALFESRLANLVKAAEYDQRTFGVLINTLLDDTKKTLMLPFSSLLEMFPRMVRDLSREAGKRVDFTSSGDNIELDRRVLEEIKDPLIHLVRNCIDHGLETPGEREAKNKPAQGKIEITVSSGDGKIEITVSDDGAGIEALKIKEAAERKGAVSQEELDRLDEDGLLALIFRSGVTTSPIITDISGRGLGLAIVREKIEKLSGRVSVATWPDRGTNFRMVVPLTMATFRGVLVRAGDQLFSLPSANVEKVMRIRREEIQTIENRETLHFDGRPISLARLGPVLGIQAGREKYGAEDPYLQVVVLDSAGKRIAFKVDEILQEQEVLVKNLGPQLSRVRNIAGAALLGNGKVVPILNVLDLMVSAVKTAPAPAAESAGEPVRRTSVLVVEDSITARALLRTIMESEGYEVATAVDGIDALTALKTREFDLVVSDIEMPRMNGFDLTAAIRADKKLSGIPVVLVTALESREDKERGIDVGADAYIVKSSFEQGNLLEVIRRLV